MRAGMMVLLSVLAMARPAFAELSCSTSNLDDLNGVLQNGIAIHTAIVNAPAKQRKTDPAIPPESADMHPCFDRALVLLQGERSDKSTMLMKSVLQVVIAYHDSGSLRYTDALAQFWTQHPAAIDSALKDFKGDDKRVLLLSLRDGWEDIRPHYTEAERRTHDEAVRAMIAALPADDDDDDKKTP